MRSTRSLNVMNEFSGNRIIDAVIQLGTKKEAERGYGLTTEEIVRLCILPLFEAYQAQVTTNHVIHRDINPNNVLLDFKENEVNFIDFDDRVHIGEAENKAFGQPGYVPPQIWQKDPEELKNIPATPQRDLFALAMLAIGTINRLLEPQTWMNEIYKSLENNLPESEVESSSTPDSDYKENEAPEKNISNIEETNQKKPEFNTEELNQIAAYIRDNANTNNLERHKEYSVESTKQSFILNYTIVKSQTDENKWYVIPKKKDGNGNIGEGSFCVVRKINTCIEISPDGCPSLKQVKKKVVKIPKKTSQPKITSLSASEEEAISRKRNKEIPHLGVEETVFTVAESAPVEQQISLTEAAQISDEKKQQDLQKQIDKANNFYALITDGYDPDLFVQKGTDNKVENFITYCDEGLWSFCIEAERICFVKDADNSRAEIAKDNQDKIFKILHEMTKANTKMVIADIIAALEKIYPKPEIKEKKEEVGTFSRATSTGGIPVYRRRKSGLLRLSSSTDLSTPPPLRLNGTLFKPHKKISVTPPQSSSSSTPRKTT